MAGIDHDIHFCPEFLSLTHDTQADTFLHEASHLFAYTDDLNLSGWRPWASNGRDAWWIEKFATRDAFSFLERFVKTYTSMFP